MAGLVFAAALAVFLSPPLQFLGNDTRPAVFTAVSLAKRADFDLDEFAPALKGKLPNWPYYVLPTRDGGGVSRFGMGPPLVAVPVFLPVLLLKGKVTEAEAFQLGRLAGAICVAAAAALLFLTGRRAGWPRANALAVAVLYAFGTCAFSVASQALWQHGPAELFLALGLFLLAGRGGPFAGAAFAAAVLCRPPDAVFALAATAHALVCWRRTPRRLLIFFVTAAPLALAQLAYNHSHFGASWHFAQTLKVTGQDALPDAEYWANNPLVGLLGQLLSPSRGLFVYTPAFLFVVVGLLWTWKRQPPFLRFQLGGALVLLLLLSRYYGWYGGWCFGYRMLVDAAPALCLAAGPLIEGLVGARRFVFAAALAASVVIHGAGAFNYSPGDWDMHPDIDKHRERLWSVSESQLVYVFTHRRHLVAPAGPRVDR